MRLKCLVATIFFAITARAQNEVSLLINDTAGPVINKNIYGQFAEHLGRCVYDGLFRNGKIRMDVVDALKKIKIPLLRWPGGCFADNYHWQGGVGPLAQRAKTVNIMWGMVPEDNSFGTDEFLHLCELIGCEPYLAGNVGTGTPDELENWIEYCNFNGTSDMANLRKANGHAQPYNVKYWGIGNESWGCGGRMTPDVYVAKYKTFANYCREYPGAPLMRIASGANADDYGWTEYLMGHISQRWLQGIGVHYYSDAGGRTENFATSFTEDNYISSLQSALNMEAIIRGHEAIMDRYDPGKGVALIIDEWGMVVGDEESQSYFWQQNSLRDALAAASTLNIFNNHADRIRMANLAQITNVLQSLVLTSGDSMLLTPTYHIFDLYRVHQDAKLLEVKYNSPVYAHNNISIPSFNVSASRNAAGEVHLSLVNLDPDKSIRIKIPLRNLPSKSMTGQILTAAKITDINTFTEPGKIHIANFTAIKRQGNDLIVELPAKSVVTIELK